MRWVVQSLLTLALLSLPGCATSRLPGAAGAWQAEPPEQPWIGITEVKVELKREQLQPAIDQLRIHPMIELTEPQAAAMADGPLPLGGAAHWMLVRALGRPGQGFHHHVFINPDGLQLWISGNVVSNAPKEPALYALIVAMDRLPREEFVSVSEGR